MQARSGERLDFNKEAGREDEEATLNRYSEVGDAMIPGHNPERVSSFRDASVWESRQSEVIAPLRSRLSSIAFRFS